MVNMTHTTTSTFSHSDDWRKLALQMSTSNRMAVTKNANDANDTYWYPPVRLMLQANKPIAPNVYAIAAIQFVRQKIGESIQNGEEKKQKKTKN